MLYLELGFETTIDHSLPLVSFVLRLLHTMDDLAQFDLRDGQYTEIPLRWKENIWTDPFSEVSLHKAIKTRCFISSDAVLSSDRISESS